LLGWGCGQCIAPPGGSDQYPLRSDPRFRPAKTIRTTRQGDSTPGRNAASMSPRSIQGQSRGAVAACMHMVGHHHKGLHVESIFVEMQKSGADLLTIRLLAHPTGTGPGIQKLFHANCPGTACASYSAWSASGIAPAAWKRRVQISSAWRISSETASGMLSTRRNVTK
jgi:hypothetical protein